MTNLEIMQRGVAYTTNAYMNAYSSKMSSQELDYNAAMYSAQALYNVLNAPNGMCANYTRQGNLRYDLAGLGKDSIKNELLKNIINVSMYQRVNDTRAGNELGTTIRPGMNSDQIAVVVMNAMVNQGVEKGYEMLQNPDILLSACQSFAYYQGSVKRINELEHIANVNKVAIYMNNELDTHYARYGDRSVNNNGYDANNGFARK